MSQSAACPKRLRFDYNFHIDALDGSGRYRRLELAAKVSCEQQHTTNAKTSRFLDQVLNERPSSD